MDDPHESEKYLVRWTKAKVADFGERAKRFIDQDGLYAFVVEKDVEAPKTVYKIVLRKEFPWELRGIAADAIKNMRDALDQCALHCTDRINKSVPGGRKRSGKGTHFPFGESPQDFDDVLTGKVARQSKDIAPELHGILRRLQPYPTGNGYTGGNDRLRHIGRVSGPNKHEVTLTVGLNPNDFGFNRFRNPMDFPYRLLSPRWDAAKNEAVVAEAHIDSYLKFDFDFTSYVAFDHPLIGGAPADLVLRQLTEVVEDVVTRLIAETDDITA